jgi:hypothetical protein
MIERQSEKGVIEVYYVQHPSDPDRKSAALRRAVTSAIGERVGPVNQSQPIRAETNRTSAAAGSRR